MPQITAPRSTATAASALVRVSMDEMISIMPIDDVPLQNYLSSKPISNIKPQWLNEELDQQTAVVNAISAAASTTIVLVDSSGVRVGDVLKKQNGTVMAAVTANVYGTNTLTVIRPFAGSTDEGLAVNDILEIVGQNVTEGANPPDPRDLDPTGDFNYTQIYQEQVSATRTARKNDQYAIRDPYAHQAEKKFRELNMRYERTIIHGRRNQSGATRQMGGFFYFVTSNLVSDVKANTQAALTTMLQNSYNVGATPRTLIVSPAMKRQISVAASVPSVTVMEQRTDRTAGVIKDSFNSDFGAVDIVMDRYMPKQKALLVQSEYVNRLVFDGWFLEALAQTGDSSVGEIVSEQSLEVRNAKAHGILTLTDL